MTLEEFPGEIIARVFSYIPNDSLYQCMQVCRLWYKEGSRLCYNEVLLINNHVQFLERTKMISADGFRIGDTIETLTIHPKSTLVDQILSQAQFTLMIDNLPNLKVIHFIPDDQPHILHQYMTYFNIICRYTNIEQVTIPTFRHSSKRIRRIRRLHYMANRILHNQITNFTLDDFDVRMIKHEGQRILTSLSKFKKLTYLSLNVRDTKERSFYAYAVNLGSLLRACPHLQTLKLKHCFEHLDNLNGDQMFPGLTTLEADITFLDETYLQFVVDRLPNLKRLILRRMCASIISGYSVHFISKLGFYLQRLDFCVIESGAGSDGQDIALFWNLVREIYTNDMRCNMNINFDERDTSYESITFDRENKILAVYVTWDLTFDLDSTWIRYVDFLIFASVQITNYCRNRKEPLTSIFVHPIFLEHRPFLAIQNRREDIILGVEGEPLLDCVPYYGYNPPKVDDAFFRYINVEKELLETIGSFHPQIKKISFEECTFPMEDNHSLIDLRQFTDIRTLNLDLDLMIRDIETIYIVCEKNLGIDYYCHQRDDSVIRKVEMVPESAPFIKIQCVNIQGIEFVRKCNILPIIQDY